MNDFLKFPLLHFTLDAVDYGLTQEYITPQARQQNGLCERFIKPSRKSSAGATASNPSITPDPNSVPGSTATTTTDHTNHSNTSHQPNTTNNDRTKQPKDHRLSNFKGNITFA
jgi:transposase InsO family protein